MKFVDGICDRFSRTKGFQFFLYVLNPCSSVLFAEVGLYLMRYWDSFEGGASAETAILMFPSQGRKNQCALLPIGK